MLSKANQLSLLKVVSAACEQGLKVTEQERGNYSVNGYLLTEAELAWVKQMM